MNREHILNMAAVLPFQRKVQGRYCVLMYVLPYVLCIRYPLEETAAIRVPSSSVTSTV